MTIHPNAPSKAEIDDPEEYLRALMSAYPLLGKKDAERKVLKRFPWWNPWKPSGRPEGFTKKSDGPQDNEYRQGYQDDGTSPYQERWDRVRRQRHQREKQSRGEGERKHQEKCSREGVGMESLEALFKKGNQAILDWSSKTADYSRFRVEDHHTDADAVQIVLSALSQMREERDKAIALISLLTGERNALRSHMASLHRSNTPAHQSYAKVGLHEGCPDFVLQAARTAYRKALHPDGQPERHRADAQRRFIEAEGVFEEIRRLRGR